MSILRRFKWGGDVYHYMSQPTSSHNLLNSQILNGFIAKIKEVFPSSDAVIIADKHGFPIASRIDQPQFDEELLAVSAITDRKLMDLPDHQKVVRPLSNDVKLLVLLKKAANNISGFKRFNLILEKENPV